MFLILHLACSPDFPVLNQQEEWPDHDFDTDGLAENQGDCNDDDPAVLPGAPETCDGVDNDCDGATDEDPIDPATWYTDADADGYGNDEAPVTACEAPVGTVSDDTDCDDTDAEIGPPTTYFGDGDGDGYGTGSTFVAASCADLTTVQMSLNELDCDDTDALISPDTVWTHDGDGDGYGDPFDTMADCDPGESWVLGLDDCDDVDTAVGPSCAWLDLSMSSYTACAVRGNGLLRCWGDNYGGLMTPPTDSGFLSVDVADLPNTHFTGACAVREDHSVACWGDPDQYSIVDDCPTTGEYQAISVGPWHACALTTAGGITCWGYDVQGSVADTPTEEGFLQVIVGESLTVALDAERHVRVWGNGASFPNPAESADETLPDACRGEAGGNILAPGCDLAMVTEGLGDAVFDEIGVERTRVCGLRHSSDGVPGELRCVGAVVDVERGGSAGLPMGDAARLSVGWYRTCVLSSVGAISCDGSYDAFVPDLAQGSGYVSVALSMTGTTDCALWEDGLGGGTIYCWGSNERDVGEPPDYSPDD